MVPLAVYVMLRVVSDRPPFTVGRDTPRGFGVRFFDRAGILWLLACVAIASTGAYYAVFTVGLLAVLAVVDFVANRRLQALVSGALVLAVIGAVAARQPAAQLIYWQEHGENDALFRRLPYETEFEGLKVSQLLLPIPTHRFEPFAETQADSTRFSPVPSEEGQHLGVIGALGFLGILAALLLAARRRPDTADGDHAAAKPPGLDDAARAPPEWLRPSVVLRTLGVLTITAILLATVSGFSLLISGAGFREIRSWNRIVVFIAFFAFIAVAYGLDWVARRVPDRPWRRLGDRRRAGAGPGGRHPRPSVARLDPRLRRRRRRAGRATPSSSPTSSGSPADPSARGGVPAPVPLLPGSEAGGEPRPVRPRARLPAQRRPALGLGRRARARRRLAGERRGAAGRRVPRPHRRGGLRRARARPRRRLRRRRADRGRDHAGARRGTDHESRTASSRSGTCVPTRGTCANASAPTEWPSCRRQALADEPKVPRRTAAEPRRGRARPGCEIRSTRCAGTGS